MSTRIAGLAFWITLAAISPAQADDRVTVYVGFGSFRHAPLYIADQKGFFKEDGILADLQMSYVDIVAIPMYDVGVGVAGLGVYNAASTLKIVADKGSSQPGYGISKVLVRKDHVESGRYKEPKDLKGMKVYDRALRGPYTMRALLKSAGLSSADVVSVWRPPLTQLTGLFESKEIDAAVAQEPDATVAFRSGVAVVVKTDDEIIPYHQAEVLLYTRAFASKRPDVARRFMRAYLKGVRFYNDALANGKLAGPKANEVIAILRAANISSSYESITPIGINPDGRVSMASIADDLAFYGSLGQFKGDVKLDRLVDHSFVEAAVQEIGPYRK